jgi:hypothetical protein
MVIGVSAAAPVIMDRSSNFKFTKQTENTNAFRITTFVTGLVLLLLAVDIHAEPSRSVSERFLYDFRIMVLLQDAGVASPQCVSTLQAEDPGLFGCRLDSVLHDAGKPVRLCAIHRRAGEDVVAVS